MGWSAGVEIRRRPSEHPKVRPKSTFTNSHRSQTIRERRTLICRVSLLTRTHSNCNVSEYSDTWFLVITIIIDVIVRCLELAASEVSRRSVGTFSTYCGHRSTRHPCDRSVGLGKLPTQTTAEAFRSQHCIQTCLEDKQFGSTVQNRGVSLLALWVILEAIPSRFACLIPPLLCAT